MATFLSRALDLTPITPPPPLPDDVPGDAVVIGLQNWLYFDETVNQSTLDLALFDRLIAELDKADRVVTNSGRSFVYAIPPNKAVVYPETLPGWEGSEAQANSAAMRAAFAAAAEPKRVDLWGPFAAATDQLYFKHDTHWNTAGALLGSELIAAAAAPGVWDQLDLVASPASRQGDLAEVIGAEWVIEYEDQTPTLSGISPDITIESIAISGRPLVSYSSPASPELADAPTIVIHDSFGMFFRNKLGPLFEEVTFFPTFSHPIPDAALPFLAASEQVVVEVVERNALRDFLGAGTAGTLAAVFADDYPQTVVGFTELTDSVEFTIPAGTPGSLRYLIVDLDTSAMANGSALFMGSIGDFTADGDAWPDEITKDTTRYGFEIMVDSGAMEVALPGEVTVTAAYVIVVE